MNTTLSYALDDILTYKLDIKAAINAKGGNAGDTLSYYATAISNLPTSSQRAQWPDGVTCQNSAPSVDWSQYDTSNVTDMANMFSGCDTSNMTNLSYFDTSSAISMHNMFNDISVNGCINEYDQQTGDLISSYLPFDLSQFDTSNVTDMGSMFNYCQYLTYLDVSSFNTSNVTDMSNMFNTCSHLTYLDVSSFNTYNVTNMYAMFNNCSRLTQLDVSSFDTSNVTNMGSMFQYCQSLTYLDLSSFNTYNVTDMNSMFYDNPYLTYINVSSFDTSNVTTMEEMFHCHRLAYIDVSSFDYTNVYAMRNMFYDSTATLINLSNANFATDGSCDTSMMFYVNWYDEGAQTQHSWSNITRTVVLDNVSNDVFNYLTQNTCPASEYGADYDTNSNSIAPNWIIHRDGNVYEYDDVNRQWSITGQVPTPTPPQPEPTSPYFTSPADGDTITGTLDTELQEFAYPIELEYGDGTPIPYDITSMCVTCDSNDWTIGYTEDADENDQSYISGVTMSAFSECSGNATLTYEDPDTGDTCTASFDYDISAAAEPQQSVILTSANIRTAQGDSETGPGLTYPYNNVNPINTIDANLTMSLDGNPAIACYNLANGTNSNIELKAGCGFTLESSVDQIAQVIITLNADYNNDTSELDVQPDANNQLIYDVYDMQFSGIYAPSTPLYITQIEVIYDSHAAE